MARGKYLSLEEARRFGQLHQFAKEHPSTGDAHAFETLFQWMVSANVPRKPSAAAHRASGAVRGEE